MQDVIRQDRIGLDNMEELRRVGMLCVKARRELHQHLSVIDAR
jgi:hypothetical protein